ncbi:peptide MFS transporter [Pseudogemmatithrix spongiicola]|uniref:Peptide MFS transporter n=1 Tax=Pseudogemmatithrix spongiicola TaxID=3062599 RepID=A0AA49JST8_9BACT|nr:peptide MFS transporter [Gemmatimonadaceae bacterium 'strain 138']WKW14209.1 peptide MFS transporter [Gemmatimonadaceae bacterium 'strain 318']
MTPSPQSDAPKPVSPALAPYVNDTRFFGHPRGLSTLFMTEMWERFSYYGLRPLLVLFMAAALNEGGFGLDRTQASAIVGIYAASVYLASLPGGWIADRWLGLRRAILIGAALITSGHLAIGVSGFAGARGKIFFFLGLALIVLGTGLLKPNISAIVGDLYPEGGARRDAGFSIFYMGINVGAFLGQLVTGFLGEAIGWHWGFGAAGVGMLFGFLWFWLRAKDTLGPIGEDIVRDPDPAVQAKREQGVKTATYAGLGLFALVFVLAALGVVQINPQVVGQYMTFVLVGLAVAFFATVLIAGGLNTDEKKRVGVIFVLFVFAAIFWGAFEQAPTSLNLFAKDFTDRSIFGWEMPATWFQSVNSFFIIVLAPVFAGLWVWMAKRNIELSSPAKFALGLAMAGVGFALMIGAANKVVASGGTLLVSPWWLIGSYFFQTVGELCLSPVGLSSMTKLSPRQYVGQMMGIWFLAASVGNLVAGLVGGHVDPTNLQQTPTVFIGTTIALAIATGVLLALVVPIRRMMQGVK